MSGEPVVNQHAVSQLLRRLGRLEREVQALLETAGSPTTVTEEMRARRVVLTDDEGKPAALFGVVDGAVRIELNDRRGELRVVLAISDEGRPVLALLSSHGKGGIALGVGADGSSGLEITDGHGNVRSDLRVEADGGARLAVLDDAGNCRGALELSAEGVPQLVLYDASRRSRAIVGVEGDGSLTLAVSDEQGQAQSRIQCRPVEARDEGCAPAGMKPGARSPSGSLEAPAAR